jgi:hypothetical protein
MIHLQLDKWLIKVLQICAVVIVYFATATVTCQLLHSPEAHIFRFFIRILSTI